MGYIWVMYSLGRWRRVGVEGTGEIMKFEKNNWKELQISLGLRNLFIVEKRILGLFKNIY